ncbi:similar to forkhead box R2 (predicted) [Rattus norvegicus]|uniref:Similar to forkhead box R2 (Predicted) n=1 Tax=Rattus norvegicus TaxID=10116 RepID=A6KL61_RAT|nr:similar to forkhead box R2 (predicted) [Rattus norvegicus]
MSQMENLDLSSGSSLRRETDSFRRTPVSWPMLEGRASNRACANQN